MVAEFGGKFSLTTLSYETKRYVHVLCYQDVPVLNAPTAPYKAAIPSILSFLYSSTRKVTTLNVCCCCLL